jgi:hypothetical protein
VQTFDDLGAAVTFVHQPHDLSVPQIDGVLPETAFVGKNQRPVLGAGFF